MSISKKQPPILVTGAHRSGTTFVGKMLSIRSDIGYVHEPFNGEHGLEGFDRYFLYLREGLPCEPAYAASIANLLAGQAVYKLAPPRTGAPLRTILRPTLRSKENLQYMLSTKDPRVRRLLIKDPIACLSSEYLHRKFAMDVVIIVRHPAAFVSSLRRMDWRITFSEFLSQPALMDDHMAAILSGHDLDSLSEVEKAALMWTCLYSAMTTFARRNPRMITVRHEDLSYDPIAEFQRVYEGLGIDFSSACRRKIEAFTKATNPVAPVEGDVHTLRRDSRANVHRWKEILEEAEIERIRSLTGDVSGAYYQDSDW